MPLLLQQSLVLLMLQVISSSTIHGWQTVLHQHTNSQHLQTRPKSRYSHSATSVGGEMVVAFGYFYDHNGCVGERLCGDGAGPTWLADVWAFGWSTGKSRWRRIWNGGPPSKDLPTPRMNHVAVPGFTESSIVIFGGSGARDQKFNDVWELDLKTGRWELLAAAGHEPGPSPRDCSAAARLQGSLLAYGGFAVGSRLGDLWSFDIRSRRWQLLIDKPPEESPDHPGRRVSHAAVTAPNGRDMYVFGGFRFESDVTDASRFPHGRLADLWLYNGADNRWQAIPQLKQNGGRDSFSMVLAPAPQSGDKDDASATRAGLLVFGGVHCTPDCALSNSTDFFSLHDQRWSKIHANSPPLHRYHHSAVMHRGSLYIFGGESYEPHMYHNAVERLSWPPPSLMTPVSSIRGGDEL